MLGPLQAATAPASSACTGFCPLPRAPGSDPSGSPAVHPGSALCALALLDQNTPLPGALLCRVPPQALDAPTCTPPTSCRGWRPWRRCTQRCRRGWRRYRSCRRCACGDAARAAQARGSRLRQRAAARPSCLFLLPLADPLSYTRAPLQLEVVAYMARFAGLRDMRRTLHQQASAPPPARRAPPRRAPPPRHPALRGAAWQGRALRTRHPAPGATFRVHGTRSAPAARPGWHLAAAQARCGRNGCSGGELCAPWAPACDSPAGQGVERGGAARAPCAARAQPAGHAVRRRLGQGLWASRLRCYRACYPTKEQPWLGVPQVSTMALQLQACSPFSPHQQRPMAHVF